VFEVVMPQAKAVGPGGAPGNQRLGKRSIYALIDLIITNYIISPKLYIVLNLV
jgi:hypothetical protein